MYRYKPHFSTYKPYIKDINNGKIDMEDFWDTILNRSNCNFIIGITRNDYPKKKFEIFERRR